METFICEYCGREHPAVNSFHVGTHKVCIHCYAEDLTVCRECGKLTPRYRTKRVINSNGNAVRACGDCLREKYRYCIGCDNWFPKEHMARILEDGTNAICRDCEPEFTTCEDCGSPVRTQYAEMEDGHTYCHSCYVKRYEGTIYSYGYKPTPEFGRTSTHDGESSYSGKSLMIGVELEIDYGDKRGKCVKEFENLTDRIYCKCDGSLNDGVEIVSHPCTYAYHCKKMPWKKIMETALRYNFRSHDTGTCGLHFHVGRKQLGGDYEIGKVIALVERMRPTLMALSRRKGDTNWCEPNPMKEISKFELETGRGEKNVTQRICDESYNAGRYLMVNVQNNNTIEFRFFKGTLNYESFMAAMQLITNICLYAMDHSLVEIAHAVPEDIYSVREYAELRAYIARRPTVAPETVEIMADEQNHHEKFTRGAFVTCPDHPEYGIGMVVQSNMKIGRSVYVGCVWSDIDYDIGHSLGGALINSFSHSGLWSFEDKLELAEFGIAIPRVFYDECFNNNNFAHSLS